MAFWKQIILVVVLAAALAGGWYVYANPHAVGLAEAGAGAAGEAAAGRQPRIPGLLAGGAVNVVVSPVAVDSLGDTFEALGTAKAVRSVVLYPEDPGIVAEVSVTPGREVHTGDLLFRLEDAEQKVAVERAQITLEQTQAALKRQQALAKSKTISSVALSDAETAVRMAEVELKSAQVALDRRSVDAPFDGIVGLTDISIGDFVTTTTPLTTVEDLSTMRVDFEVPERWSGRVTEGQAITATAPSLPGSKFPGAITGIDNRVDATTRTLRLRAELANDDRALKTGMAIMVGLEFGSGEELSVPSLSVQWDRRGSFVWKVVEGAARRADVAIVRRQSGIVVVKGDVAAGDTVVVEGVQRLREGAKVALVSESPEIVDAEPQAPRSDAAPSADAERPPAGGREVSGAEPVAGTRS